MEKIVEDGNCWDYWILVLKLREYFRLLRRNDCNIDMPFVFSLIGCGSVMNNTLKSPNYPMDYPGKMDCIYNVTIPQNMALKIFFEDFLLQNPSVYNDEW